MIFFMHSHELITMKAWRCQNGNQKPWITERQTIQNRIPIFIIILQKNIIFSFVLIVSLIQDISMRFVLILSYCIVIPYCSSLVHVTSGWWLVHIVSYLLLLTVKRSIMYHYTYKLCVYMYTHVDTHIYKDEWKLKFQAACIHMIGIFKNCFFYNLWIFSSGYFSVIGVIIQWFFIATIFWLHAEKSYRSGWKTGMRLIKEMVCYGENILQ
jgi:hypothetical protein